MLRPHILAFFLPQYHPVKENNDWFGEGFTEWTNVAKARPLFKGHQQPRIPADLGFYDLRIPEVRQAQADLAKEAKISAFCYYHYWFGNNRKILEKPLEQIVATKSPEFPFCLCWANHSWYKKNWNPDVKRIDQKMLIEQTYPGKEDIIQHFNYLLPMFRDHRYYKIDGKLVFVLYDCLSFPNFEMFKSIWNRLAKQNSLSEFYFIGYATSVKMVKSKIFEPFDGVILSLIMSVDNRKKYSKFQSMIKILRSRISEFFNYPLRVYPYKKAMSYLLDDIERNEKVIPEILPNWDYTPRRGAGGLILTDAKPIYFKSLVKAALTLIKDKPKEKQIIFLKSWNEWGEGNYMEPDLNNGKGYIKALNDAITEFQNQHE